MSKEFSLREYQVAALNVIHADLQTEKNVLLVAMMGAGKTIVVVRLINRYWFETERRFLVLVNKQELVGQFERAFIEKTDIPDYEVKVACAGVGRKHTGRLTIASVQTFVNMVDKYSGCDLLVLDEVHGAGSVGDGGQYDTIIKSLRKKNDNMRLLGVTATPFALGRGMIYGDKVRDGIINYFERINHKITYDELLNLGHLVKLRGKVAHAEQLTSDLSDVKVNGDYVLDQLGEIMVREIHLQTAHDAILQYCGGFRHICVFCCTISHAEKLREIISRVEPCVSIHSQLTPTERATNMAAWRSGDVRICTSVNILAEGFDFPALDCLVFARPTLSARLYLQALGRVLRTHQDKESGFVLDLTDNTARFGTDLDNVRVDVPKTVVSNYEKNNELFKLCPLCLEECHKALRICKCGFEWPTPEVIEADHVPEVSDVTFEKKPPELSICDDMRITAHRTKADKMIGKITMYTGFRSHNMWLCTADFYSGFAVRKGEEKWAMLRGSQPYPQTVEELMERFQELQVPDRIVLDVSGKYPEITGVEYDAFNEEVPF